MEDPQKLRNTTNARLLICLQTKNVSLCTFLLQFSSIHGFCLCVLGGEAGYGHFVDPYMEYTQTNIVLIILRREKMNRSMEQVIELCVKID